MVELPSWAISSFVVVFFAVAGLAGFGIKAIAGRLHTDMKEMGSDLNGIGDKIDSQGEKIEAKIDDVSNTVNNLDKRLVRVETIINGSTPPLGTPAIVAAKDDT